jgi:hypothetical protein
MKSFSENRVALGYEQKKISWESWCEKIKKKKHERKRVIKRRDKIKKMG